MFKGLQRNDTPLRHRPIPGRGHQQRAVEASPRDQSWPGTLMALGIFVSLISFWAVLLVAHPYAFGVPALLA